MTTIFPSKLQKILDKAVLHLWDKEIPLPDLSPLEEWLETDGWDDVVSGIQGSYILLSEASEFLSDENLMEFLDIDQKLKITNDDRISFARNHMEFKISESMDSFHSIDIETKKMPSAVLCITLYYHGQGGALFHDISVCHSTADYLQDCNGEIIMDPNDLSDLKIIEMWKSD